MRRLPVYFLIDVSESMVGDKQFQVEEGIKTIINGLRADPYALETVHISIIIFAGKAQVLSPLTDICEFHMPPLPIGSGTSLSAGLNLLMYEIDTSIRKTTATIKGDWKPIIFLFTDGIPTENPAASIEKWNNKYRNNCNLIAVSIGNHADTDILNKLTDNALRINDTNQETFISFFKWVTNSIKSSSAAASECNYQDSKKIPNIPPDFEKIDNSTQFIKEDDSIVFLAQCSTTHQYYLIRYEKINNEEDGLKLDLLEQFKRKEIKLGDFIINGAYKIEKEIYNSLSDNYSKQNKINTKNLHGSPEKCPYCNNNIAFVYCDRCDNISCGSINESWQCTWCGLEGIIGIAENLKVSRTRG